MNKRKNFTASKCQTCKEDCKQTSITKEGIKVLLCPNYEYKREVV